MNIQATLLTYFQDNPNVDISLNKLAEATGLQPTQVQSGINILRRRNENFGRNLVVVTRANIWRYVPNSEPNGSHDIQSFVLVGSNQEGITILQDPYGDFWKAQKLS